MSGPRRAARRRATKVPILVVTNGAVTEVEYLSAIARRANRENPELSVKVKSVAGSPQTVLKKLRSPNRPGSSTVPTSWSRG